ncbi:MAG: alpha-L-fucosidase [Clostridia bacterium]|nr:alpha-L-fucosidase [Clostridia bacterium]
MIKSDDINSALKKSWCTDNGGREKDTEETKRLISVVPDERQLDFLKLEYYNFIHFGINTFYKREWGDGKEDISRFNPEELDTDQWCAVLKETGSKGIIITAKHHDGFCLFDTKHTDHNVMNTPFGKDIVKMLSESCKKYDLKLGIYLSPWDRHEESYGTDAYNDYFTAQLTELCSNYGELFALWFDGACGEGKNGKKQVYDWDRYYSVIRELQPKAVIAICGPDVRWIGNEAGKVRESEWSVIPSEKDANAKVMDNSQQKASEAKKLATVSETDADLGSRAVVKDFDSLVFKPAEADVSVNYGWFYNDKKFRHASKMRKAEELADIYFGTVGSNASLLMNVPPNRKGLIDQRNVEQLKAFTALIKAPFENEEKLFASNLISDGHKLAPEALFEDGEGYMFLDGEKGVHLVFEGVLNLTAITMRENLAFSQRVEAFEIYASKGKGFTKVYEGTVIGSKKIVLFKKPIKASEILIVPTESRGNPVLKDIRIFKK